MPAGACLNCGTLLIDSHCHRCGQYAHVHRTLSGFLHDLLHGVLHFEGKIWRTVPRLVWYPGELTREYIAGRRASYVSPIAIFLFSVFIMFAVVRQLDIPVSDSGIITINGKSVEGLAANRAEVERLQRQKTKMSQSGRPTVKIEAEIKNRQEALDTMVALRGAANEPNGQRLRELNVLTGVAWLDTIIGHIKSNPGLAVYKLQNNAYKFSWLLIPFSVPFIWLLFIRGRSFPLFDHTVFVTYSLSFMTLFATALAVFSAMGVAIVAWAAAIVPPIHIYRQLRGTYELAPVNALWRMLLVIAFAFTVIMAFAILLLVVVGT